MTVAVVHPGARTYVEKLCHTQEEMLDAVNEAACYAALNGVSAEVWVLRHNHAPTPDDDCDCDDYMRPPGPYCTFNMKEALEKDCS